MTYSVPKSAAEAAPLMTTSDLWAATHTALCHQRWSEARALLDVLGQRSDVVDRLPAYSAYDQGDAGERAEFGQLLQDRIDLVNSRVDSGR